MSLATEPAKQLCRGTAIELWAPRLCDGATAFKLWQSGAKWESDAVWDAARACETRGEELPVVLTRAEAEAVVRLLRVVERGICETADIKAAEAAQAKLTALDNRLVGLLDATCI